MPYIFFVQQKNFFINSIIPIAGDNFYHNSIVINKKIYNFAQIIISLTKRGEKNSDLCV